MDRPQSVDQYVARLDGAARQCVEELRELAGRALADRTRGSREAIKWGAPAWLHASGTILFVVSAHRRHVNVTFTPSTREAFDEELAGWDTGKGSVKLPYGEPVPEDLLRRMIAHRVREHEDDGVLWM